MVFIITMYHQLNHFQSAVPIVTTFDFLFFISYYLY